MESAKPPPEAFDKELVKTDSSLKHLEFASMEWDAADEKRIRRRMDVRIVPAVFVLYLLCFIDR